MVDRYHCRFHPEKEAVIYCEKYEYGYCKECRASRLACSDPENYCKFRTHCIIWENCREVMKKNKTRAG